MHPLIYVYALGIAAAYAGWPLIGKYSGVTGSWVSTFVLLGTTFVGIAVAAPEIAKTPMPSLRSIGLLFLAGAINGIAVYVYSLQATDVRVDTGVFLTTVFVLMVVLAPIFDWTLHGTTLNLRQVFGVGLAVISIYLLRK